jgi:hypothetical protein
MTASIASSTNSRRTSRAASLADELVQCDRSTKPVKVKKVGQVTLGLNPARDADLPVGRR